MRIEHATLQNKYLLAFTNEIFNSTKKIIVPLIEINDNKNTITWAIPYETLLLSAASGKENSKTIYPLRDQELNSINLNDDNLVLGAPFYLKHSASRLNKNYFILDQSHYIKLKSFPKPTPWRRRDDRLALKFSKKCRKFQGAAWLRPKTSMN